MSADSSKKKANKARSPEEALAGFKALRNEQLVVAAKINEIEADVQEHRNVIKTLQPLDANRKCFRLIGGILVERTVGEVLPMLVNHEAKLIEALNVLHKQLTTKGEELNAYRIENNIQIRANDEGEDSSKVSTENNPTPSVLVS